MQAFAWTPTQVNPLGLGVLKDVVRGAVLQRTEGLDESARRDAIAESSLLHQGFLVSVALEILHGPAGVVGFLFQGLAELLGAGLGMLGEILQEDSLAVETARETRGVGQTRKRPPEAEPVEPAEDP
jgi:hypothetical protein